MPDWKLSELTLPEVVAAARGDGLGALALTVLYHPDPDRIGDSVVLEVSRDGFTLPISRLTPLFSAAAGSSSPAALEDPYLSRSPVTLYGDRPGLTVQAAGKSSLRINGRPIQGSLRLSVEELTRGVVMSLAHRVVLLLHPRGQVRDGPAVATLVGESGAMRQLRWSIDRFARDDTPVLLRGESGTGKELVAAAIHSRSGRSGGPFVPVNMAALPAELAGAELFGVRRGAFTGADTDREGYFQRADGGTLFLDEIGACGIPVQPQLLRALQQGEVQSPGGGVTRVDVRVVAATDADLEAPETGFSSALRYRLAGFEIELAPLRERREDLGLLLRHFLPGAVLASATGNPRDVSRWVALVEHMLHYPWPGNIRELSNVCRQLEVAASEPGEFAIPVPVQSLLTRVPLPVHEAVVEPPSDQNVLETMAASRWEIAEAARRLRLSRQSLYRRIQAIPELRVVSDIPGAEVETVYQQCRGDIDEAAQRLQVSRIALQRRWKAMDLVPDGC